MCNRDGTEVLPHSHTCVWTDYPDSPHRYRGRHLTDRMRAVSFLFASECMCAQWAPCAYTASCMCEDWTVWCVRCRTAATLCIPMQVVLRVAISRAFLTLDEHRPDAHRGWDIPPARLLYMTTTGVCVCVCVCVCVFEPCLARYQLCDCWRAASMYGFGCM